MVSANMLLERLLIRYSVCLRAFRKPYRYVWAPKRGSGIKAGQRCCFTECGAVWCGSFDRSVDHLLVLSFFSPSVLLPDSIMFLASGGFSTFISMATSISHACLVLNSKGFRSVGGKFKPNQATQCSNAFPSTVQEPRIDHDRIRRERSHVVSKGM
jgi:hypothetical protein